MRSPGRDQHYYSVGRDGVWNIVQSMMAAGLTNAPRILDFPSGFGRVTRYIRAAFPDADIYVGDTWAAAVNKCADTFSATKIDAGDDLRIINAPKFSVIFCGSLLTHFPEAKAKTLLDFLAGLLERGGVMIVTCSGRKNLAHETTHFNSAVFQTPEVLTALTEDYRAGKYAYVDYPGQKDYGRSFTPISWFHSYVVDRSDLAIVRFAERGWDDNQDIVTIKKF